MKLNNNDIASIDRAHHRPQSILEFKHYEVNNTDLHKHRKLLINKYEDQESFTIKSDILDITEQPEQADLQVPKSIKSDGEGTIDDISKAIATSGDEDPTVHKDREVCEAVKQEWKDLSVTPLIYRSNGLPFNKELRVVLEDVMLTLVKQNAQASFGEVKNDDMSYLKARSKKNKETGTHPTINKGTLTKSNYRDTDGASTIKAAKFIYGLENLHDFPKNVNKKVCARIRTVNGNIDITHLDAESSKHIFICDICNKSYKKKSVLYQHIQGHFKLYNCTHCNYTGNNKGNLNKHVNTKHIKNTDYNCSHCSYKAYFRSSLIKHVNAKHTKHTVYNCSDCSFKAYFKSSLLRHVNAKHTENTVYNCSYCSYYTYVKSNISRHENNKHTRNIVYNCSDCSYRTYDRSTLSSHVNSKHTKDIVYNCSYCNYKSYVKSNVKRHTNSKHTKNTVYNCSHCDYKTFNKRGLNRHINAIHTKINVFYCSHCNYKTYDKNNLWIHNKAKHKN